MASTSDPSSQAAPPSPVKLTCQCGQISLTLPYPPTKLNECHCSMCFRYGALWAYYPRDTVLVTTEMAPLRPSATSAAGTAGTGSTSDTMNTEKPDRLKSTADTETDGQGTGLRRYIRDGPDMGFVAFHSCARCGCVTHWWGIVQPGEDEDEGKMEMGVNARMMGVDGIKGIKREIDPGPGS